MDVFYMRNELLVLACFASKYGFARLISRYRIGRIVILEKCQRAAFAVCKSSRINSLAERGLCNVRQVAAASNEVTFAVTAPVKFCSAEYGSLIAR